MDAQEMEDALTADVSFITCHPLCISLPFLESANT
jgi:hypothetical protein